MISLHASNNHPLLLMKILHHCSKYSVHVKTCVDWYDNRSVIIHLTVESHALQSLLSLL